MLIGLFPELLGAGGIQRAGRQLATAMQGIAEDRGMRIQFLSLNDPSGGHEFRLEGRCVRFRGAGRNKLRFVAATYNSTRDSRLILVGHPHLGPVAWALRGLRRGARYVVVAHGIDVWERLPTLRRHALQSANLVLAPSNDTAERVGRIQGVPQERIRRLAWCLDPEFLRVTGQKTVPPRPPGFPGGRVVLAVARLAANERYKGVDDLIRVLPGLLPAIPDLHLAVAGDGDDRQRLQELAKHLGMRERVVFLGSLQRDNLIACYHNCDIFALPSSGEGFGLVFLEAMAFAKPVVAGAHGGTPDIVKHGVTGYLVNHGDMANLTDRLRLLLSDESSRRKMGAEGLALVLRDYTFDRFSRDLARLLDSFLNS